MINRIFTPFPALTTARLTLRQLSIDDAENVFALRSSPEINKYIDRQPSKKIEDAINFINKINDNIKKNNSLYWAVTFTNNPALIGTICLFSFSDEENKCEIGYELLTNFQGEGIMQEAAKAVVDYAFYTLQFQKIEAATHNKNQSSISLLNKLGFQQSMEKNTEGPDYNVFILANSIDNTPVKS